MAITNAERQALSEYVRMRMCAAARAGHECVYQEGKGEVYNGRHEGCAYAEQMLEIVARAD